jgi:hypothetical protein
MSAPGAPRPRWTWTLVLAVALLVGTGALAASWVVTHSTGTAGGERNGSVFLTDWQQTGVLSSTTPNPLPALVSLAVATPTRLPAVATPYRLDAGAVGNLAVEWTFSESVGLTVNQELEVSLTVQYLVGAVTHTVGLVVFLESQAVGIAAPLTFTFYWDSGAATGVTFGSESQISLGCAAVGTCP